jgi:hypothetical protein
MGIAAGRQRLSGALIAAIGGLGAVMANAWPPSVSSLEQQAQAEFDRAGRAVRERLEREAVGDVIGARTAAQDADAHRYRYLALKRDISRLHPLPPALPSVAARDPFVPDGSFVAPNAPLTIRNTRVASGGQEGSRAESPVWDMYRTHVSGEGAATEGRDPPQVMRSLPTATARGQIGDMYARSVATPALTDRGAPEQTPQAPASLGEAPRQPFLVYRERLGTDTRE